MAGPYGQGWPQGYDYGGVYGQAPTSAWPGGGLMMRDIPAPVGWPGAGGPTPMLPSYLGGFGGGWIGGGGGSGGGGGGFGTMLPLITKPWQQQMAATPTDLLPSYLAGAGGGWIGQPGGAIAQQPVQPAQPQGVYAPFGVDQAWWDAFIKEHDGTDMITYYGGAGPQQWRSPQEAMGEATADRNWSIGWSEQHGKEPEVGDWEEHWYRARGLRNPATSPRGAAGPGAAAQKESTWWGQPIFGTGEVEFPGYGKFNLSQVENYSQLPQPLRSWYARVVESARRLWPSPLVPPVTGFVPVASER